MIRIYFLSILLICLYFSASTLAQSGFNLPFPPSYTCTTSCHSGSNENQQGGPVASPIHQGRPGKKGLVGPRGEKGDPCQCDVADAEEIANLRQKIEESTSIGEEFGQMKQKMEKLISMGEEFEQMKQKVETLKDLVTMYPVNCSEYRSILLKLGNELKPLNEVKIYPLKSRMDFTPTTVNCSSEGVQVETWIVFQRRMDGSVDFYRGWDDYATGFGTQDGEFWMGLRKLHELTSAGTFKLRIESRNWEEETRYAEYSSFSVGDEASKFLLSVSGYSGDANDGMTYHNGRPFATHDRDNSAPNCPVSYSGAWWYGGCYHANLNGKYFPTSSGPSGNGVSWSNWLGGNYSLKFVEMKMKQV